jgi:glycerol-3-phosphate dehydrogenase (NAD(P)+)
MKVTILGSGAMGTACGILLAEQSATHVSIWGRNPEHVAAMKAERENRRLLPGGRIPERIQLTTDASEALKNADLVVVAVPTAFLRESLKGVASEAPAGVPFVSVIKGVEFGTFHRPSEVIVDVLGPRKVVALCGPSHAEELALRKPASVVAAAADESLARQVQFLFTTERFRVYTNTDLVGVELAAALKNVAAIAAGICDGLGFGDNAKSALVTRAIVESREFGRRFGAQPDTFAGLAGIGDLIGTCFSRHSRNRRVGERLGQGATLSQALDELRGVAEGVNTCRSVYHMAQQFGVEMPITAEVYRVLFEGRAPLVATGSLMQRPPRREG